MLCYSSDDEQKKSCSTEKPQASMQGLAQRVIKKASKTLVPLLRQRTSSLLSETVISDSGKMVRQAVSLVMIIVFVFVFCRTAGRADLVNGLEKL